MNISKSYEHFQEENKNGKPWVILRTLLITALVVVNLVVFHLCIIIIILLLLYIKKNEQHGI